MYISNSRFLRFSQVVLVCLLYSLVVGFSLESNSFSVPLHTISQIPAIASLPTSAPLPASFPIQPSHAAKPTYAEKNAIKLQAAQDVFESEFLAGHIQKAHWISVEGGFSLPIIQQPKGKNYFVATTSDLITQFSNPAQNGVTGLLAHNYLSGQEFYSLKIGQKVTVSYEEDIVHQYKIVSIHRFQKLDATTVYSDLIDLETNKIMSSTDVYNRFYDGTPHVTFQTCLEKDGSWDWGLMFITAEPIYP